MDDDSNDKIERLLGRQRAAQAEIETRKVVRFGKLEEGEIAEVYEVPDGSPVIVAVAPTGPVGAISGPQRDFDAIETLTQCLRQAEAGGCRGVIVLMGLPTTDDHELVTDVQCDMSFAAAENIQIFLGGMETAKRDLFCLHDDIAGEVESED